MTMGEFIEREAHFESSRAFELHKTRLIMAKHHQPKDGAETFQLKEVLHIPLYDGEEPRLLTPEEAKKKIENLPDNKTAWKQLISGEII